MQCPTQVYTYTFEGKAECVMLLLAAIALQDFSGTFHDPNIFFARLCLTKKK